eukprot:3835624-Prymnesium_polylepis.1
MSCGPGWVGGRLRCAAPSAQGASLDHCARFSPWRLVVPVASCADGERCVCRASRCHPLV